MLAGETSKHRNEADDKLVFTIRAIANMYFFFHAVVYSIFHQFSFSEMENYWKNRLTKNLRHQ